MKLFTIICVSLLAFAACDSKTPKLVPLIEEEFEKASEIGDGVSKESFRPRLDILFIIDDSGSMSTHQKNLANNIDRFASAIFKTKFLDYHIGVINSSSDSWGGATCCGRLVGSPRYVERNTPDVLSALAANLIVGTNGSATETFFDPGMMALSDPLLTGYNAGFYRQDSYLAIIFITDTDDQSDASAQQFYDFLLKLKGSKNRIFAAAAYIPDAELNKTCSGESEALKTSYLEDFFNLTRASTFSLCDPDYGDKLAEIGLKIARQSTTMYLNRLPVESSINVTMDGIEIPSDAKKGWSYNSALNAIEFGPEIEWEQFPDNVYPQVDFDIIDLEKKDK